MPDPKKSPIFDHYKQADISGQEIGMSVKERVLKDKLEQALKSLKASRTQTLVAPNALGKTDDTGNRFIGWRRR